jgi:predicted phage gp36 major capsid-like protein
MLNRASGQEEIYSEMNGMYSAMQELNSKIGMKQDLVSNDQGKTEARTANMQKNVMFFDRLDRTLSRPSWG